MTNTPDPELLPNAASVALLDRSRVLLIRRAYAPYRLLWTLPGGTREPDETAEQCARRELQEETALFADRLVHIETQRIATATTHWRLAVFATTDFTGEPVMSDEIADHRWVALDEVRQMRTTSRLHDLLLRIFARLGAA